MENNQVDPSSSILQLPDDCLYFIFQSLGCSSDRESFGLTCRRWLHIQNSSRRSLQFNCSLTLLSIASLSQPCINIKSYHLYRLFDRFQKLQSLSLSGCTELHDSGLSWLLHYGSKLQRLNLECCFCITDNGIAHVAGGCPSLTFISLYRCNVTDIGLETLSKSCTALKDVNLSYCLQVSDNGVRSLSKNCRNLRAFKISHCKCVRGTGFQGCSRTLAYLEADSCKLEPEGIKNIFSGGGLEYLSLSNLGWCFHGHGFPAISSGFTAKLRVLNFRLCRTIRDDDIATIAKGCPLLQELNLALCHEVKIAGWESIGLNCHNLERLHVNRCRNLCDQGFQALRIGCRRLRILYLGRTNRISWTAIEMFKCFRSDVEIIDEETMCNAPDWALHL